MASVIVYTSTNCPHCKQVKSFLSDKGVAYEERNIEQNDEYAQQVWDMGMRAVPVTVIGEHRILGMNKTQFDKALAELA
ncbi:glutaredoxin family protein [Paenibacillus macerans]|uniref:Glutaredoxin family protein n=1 Tax=Paenibacillus macerans TaxID=44252 RepID=A0A090ZBJ1_PAEMA|nr:glutaredoxin family protein [Paenibacillus macerans]KFN08639.1 glutaredoxin family protein [Paenibacillus macerans]MBS5913057.1 glutaredoxin family protein [Paenibacillus macerans]MCY7560572.1 glutaredoxin family protein [Paenibacillus macerans]MEC0141567.1 glutaredoxin family protein [Paenibacillus macerans]MEC0154404.1 glutaredoxin family protein [Paenibacillus macerans]